MCRLELAKINLHIEFELSTITCNKDTKGNAKYVKKNSRFEPPLGDLGVKHRIHLWLD